MPTHTPQQQIKQAKQIAHDHGCFVVEKGQRYLVYRRRPSGNVYLGFRSDPSALHAFVCKVTGFH